MNVLALVTDAFGGHGGIALYNRDMLSALCRHGAIDRVVAVARTMSKELEQLPHKLRYEISGISGDAAYLRALAKTLYAPGKFDLVICGHINLLPFAWAIGKFLRIPVVLEIYGIDAWQPTTRRVSNRLTASVDAVISISEFTRQRFLGWSKCLPAKCRLLPNAIHLERYGMGEMPNKLHGKYALHGKKVLLTFGRLVSSQRAKGFEEVLELMPGLVREIPELTYVIAGAGEYGKDLKKKARELGIKEHVLFTGMVKEAEKADLYRLADVFVMPSRGEGFGFVFLEAMACGIPVIASKADGSREAVLNGQLGQVVAPGNPDEIRRAILKALDMPKMIPDGLEYFSFENFTQRLHHIIDEVI
jgi:phosphatidyl-myo-inositol dimannoside synthase